MSLDEVPKKFNRWQPQFENYHTYLASKKINPLEACLSYPLGIAEIDKVVVGVDSLEHLIQIFHYSKQIGISEDTSFLQSNDENLINPSMWHKL
jgi:hypothetical protein